VNEGWRVACLWIAGLSGGVGLLVALVVLRGDPPRFGLRPYGASAGPGESVTERTGCQKAGLTVPRSGRGAATVVGTRDLTLLEAMRTRSLWLFAIVMFVCGGGDTIITTHLVPLVTDHGISTGTAAGMLAWLGLLSLGGLLLAGPAADLVNNKIPIAVTFGLRVILFGLILTYKGVVPFWIFSLGFGLTLLVTAPLKTTLVGALYGVTHLGFICGFVTTFHMLGAGMWAYLGGLIYDKTGDYDLAFVISLGLAALAVICTLLIREERHTPPEVLTRTSVEPERSAA